MPLPIDEREKQALGRFLDSREGKKAMNAVLHKTTSRAPVIDSFLAGVHAGRQLYPCNVEDAAAILSNAGCTLTGNTGETDLGWLAQSLFAWSRLGVADIRTFEWLLEDKQWDYLGLQPENHFSDDSRRWDQLTPAQKNAWLKLARICLHVFPRLAERVGNRWMAQASALRQVFKESAEVKA